MLLPLGLLLTADAAVTSWAARAAAADAEDGIHSQLDAVAAALTEPPNSFPLTPPILAKMKRLSGAEFVFTPRVGEPVGTLDPLPRLTDNEELELNGALYRIRRLTLPAGHPNAGGVLAVCSPEARRRAVVRRAVVPPLLLGVAVAVAAAGLLAIGGRVVSRLQRVKGRTEAIAAGDFRTLPVPPSPDDELTDLANAVNHLAARLGDYERQLQQTERLRVLGQFSGGLAHQLRNAAGGARLAVQLYLKDGDDREPLEVALRQLARMEANLCQFLALGKPPAAATSSVDVAEVLDAAVRLQGPQCRHAGIRLQWTSPGPIVLAGDATQLGHLFGNLIGNAIEAAGPGGAVELTASVDGGRIVVEVSDTGPGPSTDVADRLFEPFVTGREQGIGLGLAVAKQAADAHGGGIDWRRENGRTVFRVVLG
ncbi:MAG: HAMP domain-containing histidine kinase [Fimbriiglobus sp.]|nr:HAMP domain-containing histidine kinase [Fimbriiglobus sp.]